MSTKSALILRGHSLVYVNNSIFYTIGGNRSVYINVDNHITTVFSFVTVNNSTFNSVTLVITTNDCNKRFCSDILNVFIGDCDFGGNRYYSLHCKGTVNLPPRILIFSSNFSNNQDSAVKTESCDIFLQNNSYFFNNNKSAFNISYGTIIMMWSAMFITILVYILQLVLMHREEQFPCQIQKFLLLMGQSNFIIMLLITAEQYTFIKVTAFVLMQHI